LESLNPGDDFEYLWLKSGAWEYLHVWADKDKIYHETRTYPANQAKSMLMPGFKREYYYSYEV
jgi:hypothetical protein